MKLYVLNGPNGQLEVRDVDEDGRYDPDKDQILKNKEVQILDQVGDDLKSMGIESKRFSKLWLQPLADYLKNMKEAEVLGKRGEFKLMDDAIALAATAAERAGLKFNELERGRGPDIVAGYRAGYEHYMELADSYAKSGDEELADTDLKMAKGYATKGEISYDHDRAQKIRDSARTRTSNSPTDHS